MFHRAWLLWMHYGRAERDAKSLGVTFQRTSREGTALCLFKQTRHVGRAHACGALKVNENQDIPGKRTPVAALSSPARPPRRPGCPALRAAVFTLHYMILKTINYHTGTRFNQSYGTQSDAALHAQDVALRLEHRQLRIYRDKLFQGALHAFFSSMFIVISDKHHP